MDLAPACRTFIIMFLGQIKQRIAINNIGGLRQAGI